MIEVDINKLGLKNGSPLLQDIKFKIMPNQVYTILGKNGSGKSTLIKSLTKLLVSSLYEVNGNVFVDGLNVYEIDERSLIKIRREKISYVFQDAANSFDPLKKLEYYFEKVINNLDTASLLQYFLLPNLNQLKQLYSYELSGGMAQRVSFVLALLSDPEIIILDEPTSGIDPAIANLFLLKLKDFASKKNNSVLMVTHDLLFAEKASDQIALLKDGTLSEFIATEDFFEIKKDINQARLITTLKELMQ